ncbi:hypothetical protein F5Y16DRAFT_250073 [Xylariaceae sp. FL0255]|nr:hypothetical protein F5Y16DRAFT_250073 [Xylariaceae sp. FL0255]
MPPKSEPQWPPRSPHEALLSTPSGRDRLRRMAERASPSPSPSKRTMRSASRNARTQAADEDDMDLDLEGDDDEDEEMLELKLAAIKAKLKLKKLQKEKAKGTQQLDSSPCSASIPDIAPPLRSQSSVGRLAARSQSQAEVQVPASPVRRAQTSQEVISPSRVRLGIDKGLKAKDVSLKRAPSLRKTSETTSTSATGGSQRSNFLQRSKTPSSMDLQTQTTYAPAQHERPKSFSERLSAARDEEVARQERQQRIKQIRTNKFDLGKDEMDELKEKATEIPDIPLQEQQYSRDEVMAGAGLKRSNTMPSIKSQQTHGSDPEGPFTRKAKDVEVPPSEVPEEDASAFEPYSSVHLSKRIIPHTTLTRNLSDKQVYTIPDILKHVKAPEYQLPEVESDIVVFGILAAKSEPKAHQKPQSNLKEKADTSEPEARAKYMVLKLTDLKWELELFLFGSGFDRFYRLTPGTLLAILNPTIMPPPPNRTDTGRFSLVINSNCDTILEIGNARDLGYCKSIKKDGQPCGSWVNKKRTEFCEFHMNLALDRKRLARQEVNAFDTGLGPGKKKQTNSYRLNKWEEHANDPGKKKRGNFDRETQTSWFIHKASAATMLDNEVLGGSYGNVAGTLERSEALKRRLATEEKERDMMKKLGEVGNGAGRDYMLKGQQSRKQNNNNVNQQSSSTDPDEQQQQPPKLDAKSLGLVGINNRSKIIHLSPVKRKRVESSSVLSSAATSRSSSASSMLPSSSLSSTTAAKPALGWGGGLKDKLARMKEGEKLRVDTAGSIDRYLEEKDRLYGTHGIGTGTGRGSGIGTGKGSGLGPGLDLRAGTKISRMTSPARKKTRFITEKGIREAGRESLGDELGGGGMIVLDDEDEDELVVLPP